MDAAFHRSHDFAGSLPIDFYNVLLYNELVPQLSSQSLKRRNLIERPTLLVLQISNSTRHSHILAAIYGAAIQSVQPIHDVYNG